jgi:hypothetical protein
MELNQTFIFSPDASSLNSHASSQRKEISKVNCTPDIQYCPRFLWKYDCGNINVSATRDIMHKMCQKRGRPTRGTQPPPLGRDRSPG